MKKMFWRKLIKKRNSISFIMNPDSDMILYDNVYSEPLNPFELVPEMFVPNGKTCPKESAQTDQDT